MGNDGIRERLQELLAVHGQRRGLLLVLVDGLASVGSELGRVLVERPVAVICDATTRSLAGDAVADALAAVALIEVPGRTPGSKPVAGTVEAIQVEDRLRRAGAGAAVAVGSGTVNDLAKIACHRLDIPYAALVTAPSMNGYTSAGAALLEDGVKTTVSCRPPRWVIAPVELLRTAPLPMIQAGLGDLRSRPVSGADWYLGHRLLNTPYAAEALELVDEADRVTVGIAPDLRRADAHAVARLTTGLMLSGLAMDVAGTSAPASGGEHLISHFLDMSHFADGTPHDLHGRQVGVATLATARLYERLLELEPADLGPGTGTAWPQAQRRLRTRFGSLWPSLERTARTVHADPETIGRRLRTLRSRWPQTRAGLVHTLGDLGPLRAELGAAGAPVTFAELGVGPGLARDALLYSRYVRTRYTILDLAAELGRLEAWVDDALGL